MEGVWDWIREHLTDWGIAKVYITCAVAGGAILMGQFGLSLFGIGETDIDVDDVDVTETDAGDASDGLNLLSVRAIAGFLTLFGLVGFGGTSGGWSHPLTAVAAVGAGGSTMLFIAWMMRMFRRLSETGTMDPRQAVGKVATVYLRVPAARSGRGKITVSIQGRSVEFGAITAGEELPTGASCRVVLMTSSDTFEVAPLEQA